jgi:beta-lactamase superfamily II metal-dependent hydrolase
MKCLLFISRFRLLLLLLLYAASLQAQVTALSTASPVSGATLEVHFIDVAQGNCILIKTPAGKYMLYDAGTTSSKVDYNDIVKYITKATGGADITTIILSHADKDHVSIIPSIVQAKKPLYVHYSGNKSEYDKYLSDWFTSLPNTTQYISYPNYYSSTNPSNEVDVGQGTKVYILAANVPGDANSRSIVASVDYGNTTVLLTGDATAVTENWITQTWSSKALRATVYSFAHHGSNYSNSAFFLGKVKPQIGIFSASAEHMGYGHPRCDLLDYVQNMVDGNGKNGITIPMHRVDCYRDPVTKYVTENNDLGIFLTATQGNIVFKSDGTDYSITVDRLK